MHIDRVGAGSQLDVVDRPLAGAGRFAATTPAVVPGDPGNADIIAGDTGNRQQRSIAAVTTAAGWRRNADIGSGTVSDSHRLGGVARKKHGK